MVRANIGLHLICDIYLWGIEALQLCDWADHGSHILSSGIKPEGEQKITPLAALYAN